MSDRQPIGDTQHQLEPLPIRHSGLWRYRLTKSQRVIRAQGFQAICIIPNGSVDLAAVWKGPLGELLYHPRIQMSNMTRETWD